MNQNRNPKKELDNINNELSKYLFDAGWDMNNVDYWIDPIKNNVDVNHGIISAAALQMHRDWKTFN